MDPLTFNNEEIPDRLKNFLNLLVVGFSLGGVVFVNVTAASAAVILSNKSNSCILWTGGSKSAMKSEKDMHLNHFFV
ncbi:hypothetical protein BVRB_6g142910 [Beta vulgaris subsp. vulgaris]|nr:hypothetical protein BVRB_6g142910 [Beta vulgaris subsp. vulgaris]